MWPRKLKSTHELLLMTTSDKCVLYSGLIRLHVLYEHNYAFARFLGAKRADLSLKRQIRPTHNLIT